MLHRSSTARRSSASLLAAIDDTFRADEEEAQRAANAAADSYYREARVGLEREMARGQRPDPSAAKERAMDHRRRRLSALLARDRLSRALEWDEDARRQRYEEITSRRSSIPREDAEAAAAKLSTLFAARTRLGQENRAGGGGGGGGYNNDTRAMELAARQRRMGRGVATSLLARSGTFAGGADARAARRRELEVAGVVRSRLGERARQLEKSMAGREVGKMLRQRTGMEGGRG